MNISKRIVLGFVIVLLLALATNALGVMHMQRIQKEAAAASAEIESADPAADTPSLARKALAGIERTGRAGAMILVLSSSMAVLVGVMLGVLVARSVLMPLLHVFEQLTAYIESLASGDGEGDIGLLTSATETLQRIVQGGAGPAAAPRQE